MNKYKLLMLLTGISFLSLFAQDESEDVIHHEFYFTVLGGQLKNKSFDVFSNSYSELQNNTGQTLTKNLGSFGFAKGYMLGYKIGYFSLNFMSLNGTATAKFANGNKRHFKNTIYTPFLVGFPIKLFKRRLELHPKFGTANSTIDATFEYADGTVSKGNENLFTAQYRVPIFGMFFGFDAAYRQKIAEHHFVELGFSINAMFSKDNYVDHSWGRSGTIDAQYPTSLPLDVQSYFALGNYDYLISGAGFVRGKNSAFFFSLTYSYNFNTEKSR